MKTKISTISIALILAGFLSATAQNDISIPKKYQGESTIFESPNFDPSHLPAIKKAKSGQDWWEPDTVYAFFTYGDEFEYSVIYRLLNKYNSHGLLQEHIRQRWVNDSWVHYSSFSYTYTYDSNNNVLNRLGPDLRTYTYDSNNNMLSEQIQIRENDSWVNYMLETYTYDSNNNMLTRLIQGDWKNNSWNSSFSYTYTYDSNNNMLTHLRDDSWLSTYTYDSNNNLLTELWQNWNNYSWENYRLATYTYNSNNNMPTERLIQRWFDSWIDTERELMTYDENGNGTSVETWVRTGSGWIPFGDISTETILYYNNGQSNFHWGCHKLTASYINVSGISTAIKEPSATPELTIYPNPTTGELRMENGEWKIQRVSFYDVSGVHLFDTQQTTLNISHLPAGIYFVQIKTEKGVVTKKIVKW